MQVYTGTYEAGVRVFLNEELVAGFSTATERKREGDKERKIKKGRAGEGLTLGERACSDIHRETDTDCPAHWNN